MTTVAAVGMAAAVVFWKLSFAPVLSPSMEPEFGAGDLIVTKPAPTKSIRAGDVVVLPLPDGAGQRYAHRVSSVRTYGDGRVVRTKGDANDAPDTWTLQVTSAEVPVVVAHVRSLGQVALWLNGTGGRIALIVTVALLAMVSVMRAMFRGPVRALQDGSHA